MSAALFNRRRSTRYTARAVGVAKLGLAWRIPADGPLPLSFSCPQVSYWNGGDAGVGWCVERTLRDSAALRLRWFIDVVEVVLVQK